MPKAPRTPRSTQQQPDKSFLAKLDSMLKATEQDNKWRSVMLYSNGTFRVELVIAPQSERTTGATVSLRICGQALRNCLTIRSPQLLDEFYRAVEYVKKLQQSDKGKELVMWWLKNSYDVKRKRKTTERIALEL